MNCDSDELIIPTFKLSTEHGDYEFEVLNSKSSNEDIESEIDARLKVTKERIDSLDVEIERLTADLSKFDILCSIGSGIISSFVDILYVGELNLDLTGDGDINKESSQEKINQFIQKVANETGYTGNRLNGAISHLEDIAPVAQDNTHKLGRGRICVK